MEIVNSTRFEPEIEELRQLDIKVGQVLNLYERLGGDSSLLGEAIKKQVKEAEEERRNKEINSLLQALAKMHGAKMKVR